MHPIATDPSPTFASFLADLSERANVDHLRAGLKGKPLKLYLNSCRMLIKTADLYHRSGDYPNAFVLYMKFSNLLVDLLPKHPEYRTMHNDIVILKKQAVSAIDCMEQIKPLMCDWWEQNVKPLLPIDIADHDSDFKERVEDEDKVERIEDSKEENTAESQDEDRKRRIEEFYKSQFRQSESPPIVSKESMETKDTVTIIDHTEQQPKLESSNKDKADKDMPVFITETGMPLRHVQVPVSIVDTFMHIAGVNTARNVETCGVLGGRLLKNQLFTVTHLIIPKQRGTANTVTMLNEEEIVNVSIEHDILTLGWIHTHPTQSCFMSSVDLHTQFPFQALMAEAIAIVVAPTRSPNYGVFRLTDPPTGGMTIIGNCRLDGFHPHDGTNVYEELVHGDRAGHVRMCADASVRVIDLR